MGKRKKSSRKIKRARSASTKIIVCSTTHCIRLKAGEILFCAAEHTCTALYYTENDFILSTKHLGYWEKRLPRFFWRTHDHWLVNSEAAIDLLFSERKLQVRNRLIDIARRRLSKIAALFKKSGIR
jgi:DNA-binding LytR/AlgR family response regulator